MHGRYGHGDIVKRQGLLGGLGSGLLGNNPAPTPSNANTSPLGLGTVIGGVTSALLPPLSSSGPSTSSSSSIPSSSSTSTTNSSTSSTPSISSIPTPSSTFVVTSSSDSTLAIVTATVSASSSSSATVAPPSFLQNKPLKTGVFAVVGIIGGIIIVLIVIVWIRSSNRRKLTREALDPSSWNPAAMYGVRDDDDGAMEKLTRWNSTSSASHTQMTDHAGYGDGLEQGGYPAPSLPLPSPAHSVDGHGQPPVYHGQLLQASGYNSEYKYVSARSPYPAHNLTRSPSNNRSHLDEGNRILPPSQNMLIQPHTSFDSSPAASPFTSWEDQDKLSRHPSSHSRTLNPGMQEMPVALPLPAKFGSDEDGEYEPYSGIDGGDATHSALKVANF